MKLKNYWKKTLKIIPFKNLLFVQIFKNNF